MRGLVVPIAIAFASVGTAAPAAQPISYVHLMTERPFGRDSALYDFTFLSRTDDFQSALVFFNLNGGVRYGCGVHANASCTLHAAGQTLTLVGLNNGIDGSFVWSGNAARDNYPLEISIGIRAAPAALEEFQSSIHLVSAIPEPAAWAMMIAGFGLGLAPLAHRWASAELAVLAAAPVDAAAHHRRVAHRLTRHAGPRAGQGKAPALGNALAAVLAIIGTFTGRHPRAGAEHGVLDRVVNLVLHRPIGRPTAGHRPNPIVLATRSDGACPCGILEAPKVHDGWQADQSPLP